MGTGLVLLNLQYLEKNKMTFNFLKFKKDKTLSLKSLKSEIFDVNLAWSYVLIVSFVMLAIMIFVGFKLFYFQYTEGYKHTQPDEGFANLVNTERLKNVVQKRVEFIGQQPQLPRDPSI